MKKIKFLGTAILAASLLFAGCSSPVEDVVTEEDTSVTLSPEETGTTTTGGTSTGGTSTGGSSTGGSSTGGSSSGGSSTGGNSGSGSNEPEINYTAPDLSSYYKKYFVSTTDVEKETTGFDTWGSLTNRDINDDGSWTITPGVGSEWGDGFSCEAFTNLNLNGITIANYEYIVFTIDTTNFTIRYDDRNINNGVNIKVPEEQRDISTNCVINGNLRTYYAPVSSFGTAPEEANQFAIIIAGTGTYKLNELYFASADDPATRPVRRIRISPASGSVAQGGSQQFIVKDSNFVNRTNEVTYTLSGDAEPGSSITTAGLLTAGTTAGSLTVTATYTVDGEDFTADATITVLDGMTNLITTASATGWNTEANANPSISGNLADGWSVDYIASTFQWGAQLKIQTDADFAVGDEYYFSVDLESTADMNAVTVKFDDGVQIVYDTTTTLTANTTRTVTFSGTIAEGKAKEDVMVVFDFGNNPAATVQVSNLVLAKTN